jgi:DNA repair protein RecO (recombination protein O)
VLRGRPLSEADRIVTLFTWERGKLDAVAKGVRRARSHLSGRLEFGNECELGMHRGRTLDVIVSADIVRSPWSRLVEPERYAVAQLVAELIDAFCEPDLALPEVYALLAGMLEAVAKAREPRALLPRFELRLIDLLGFGVPTERCVCCGAALSERRVWMDARAGGLVDERCREPWRELPELDRMDRDNLRALAAPKGTGCAGLRARPKVAAAIEELLAHHLGRYPKALAALRE